MKSRIVPGILSLLLLLCMSLSPVAALAADAGPAAAAIVAAPPASDGGLMHTLLGILTPLIGALATFVVNRLVTVLRDRYNVQLQSDSYDKLLDVVDHGIHYAAEQAAKAGDKKLSSSEKLGHAASFANDQIKRLGLPDIAEEKLKALIEARLSMKRGPLDTSSDAPAAAPAAAATPAADPAPAAGK